MPTIRNKLNQRIIVNLKDGKNIGLLAKDTVNISDDDLSSPHIQTLLAKGIIVNSGDIPQKSESKKGYQRKVRS